MCNTLEEFRFSGFSCAFGVFYELGQYDLPYNLWDHTANMKHPMGPACVRYTHRPPENQIPPEIGQGDLFVALEVKLGHSDLIRNFSLMQWNLEV